MTQMPFRTIAWDRKRCELISAACALTLPLRQAAVFDILWRQLLADASGFIGRAAISASVGMCEKSVGSRIAVLRRKIEPFGLAVDTAASRGGYRLRCVKPDVRAARLCGGAHFDAKTGILSGAAGEIVLPAKQLAAMRLLTAHYGEYVPGAALDGVLRKENSSRSGSIIAGLRAAVKPFGLAVESRPGPLGGYRLTRRNSDPLLDALRRRGHAMAQEARP